MYSVAVIQHAASCLTLFRNNETTLVRTEILYHFPRPSQVTPGRVTTPFVNKFEQFRSTFTI